MRPIGYMVLRVIIFLALIINIQGFSRYFASSSVDLSDFDSHAQPPIAGSQNIATTTDSIGPANVDLSDDQNQDVPNNVANNIDPLEPSKPLDLEPANNGNNPGINSDAAVSQEVLNLKNTLTKLSEDYNKARQDQLKAEEEKAKIAEEREALKKFQEKVEEEQQRKREKDAEQEQIRKEKEKKAAKWREPFEKIRQVQLDDEARWVANPASFPGFESPDLEPKGHKIAIVSGFDNGGATGKYKNVNEMAMANRQEYADYHGYIHQFVNFTQIKRESDDEIPGFKAAWLKARAIKKVFNMYPDIEWIWWLDTDVIIMNPMLDLAHHLLNEKVMLQQLSYGQALLDVFGRTNGHIYPQNGEIDYRNIDIVISQDTLGLNAGSFFLRRSEFADWLLDLWDDPIFMEKHFDRAEQDALIHLVQHHEMFRKHLGLVPQRLLNAYGYYYDDSRKRYQTGDFLIHFAGRNQKPSYLDDWDYYWLRRLLLPESARRLAPESTTNPPRRLHILEDKGLTDEEIKEIQSGNYDHSALFRKIGSKMSNEEWSELTALTSKLFTPHKG